jgi:hypothetical protein
LLLHKTSSLPLPAFRLGDGKLGNLKWIAAADQRALPPSARLQVPCAAIGPSRCINMHIQMYKYAGPRVKA